MKFKSFLTEANFPIFIKELDSMYNDKMEIWVNQKTDTNELFLDIDGDAKISFDKIDELIKILKTIKKKYKS